MESQLTKIDEKVMFEIEEEEEKVKMRRTSET
jgi:hypothetical protein